MSALPEIRCFMWSQMSQLSLLRNSLLQEAMYQPFLPASKTRFLVSRCNDVQCSSSLLEIHVPTSYHTWTSRTVFLFIFKQC